MAAALAVPNDQVEFIWNKTVCSLYVKDHCLHVKCIKKLNILNPRPLSSCDQVVSFLDVISVTYGSAEWKLNGKADSLRNSSFSDLLQNSMTPCYVLNLYVVVRMKNHRLKMQFYKFRTYDEKNCIDWCRYIKHKLQEQIDQSGCGRPRNLLVFVNPYGGRKKAESVHGSVVSPLFEVAGIKETVIVTRYRNHAREYVETKDHSAYDGIIAIGGDGMLNEIMNGILLATQRQNNVSLDGTSSILRQPNNYVKPDIRIGVIPAGSTNCLSYVSHGTDDPETSVLRVIRGDTHPLDVCSIHDDCGKFVRFSFSMTSYGYMGNVLRQSEQMRKLGPSRYDFAGMHAFLNLQAYPSEVTYLPSSDDDPVNVSSDNSRCRYPCPTCLQETAAKQNDFTPSDGKCFMRGANYLLDADHQPTTSASCPSVNCVPANEISTIPSSTSGLKLNIDVASNKSKPFPDIDDASSTTDTNSTRGNSPLREDGLLDDLASTNDNAGWKVTKGKFLMVNSALMSCACAKCPQGLSPSAHLADGNIDLIILRDVSRADFFRYLLSHVGKANRFDFPFVEVHRVKAFHYRALSDANVHFKRRSQSLQVNYMKTRSNSVSFGEQESRSVHQSASSCWNTDGEIITDPNITLWVHRGLVSIFARGIEST